MAKFTFEQLKETLPTEIFDHYYSEELSGLYADVIFPLLSADQIDALKGLVQEVYVLAMTPEEFLDQLEELVPDEKKFNTVALNILSKDFLSVADYLDSDILSLIAALGADPNIYRWKVPVRDVIAQVLRSADITIEDEHLFTRLLKIMESRVLNARTEEQTMGQLTGPTKTSGVGLDETRAKSLLLLVNEETAQLQKAGVTILSDEEYYKEEEEEEAAEVTKEAVAVGEEAAAPATGAEGEVPASELTEEEIAAEVGVIIAEPIQPEAGPPKPAETMETVQLEDVQEARQAETLVEDNIDVGQIKTEADFLTGLVEEAISVTGVKFENEDLHRRFLNIVNLYFRDLRDAMETNAKLTMPVASGGMGMSDEEGERVIATLEMKAKEYHQLMTDRSAQDKQQYVTARTEQVIQRAESDSKKEQDARDQVYTRLVSKTGAPAPVTSAAAPALSAAIPQPPRPKFIPVIAVDSKPPVRPVISEPPVVGGPVKAEPVIIAATAPPPAKLPEVPATPFIVKPAPAPLPTPVPGAPTTIEPPLPPPSAAPPSIQTSKTEISAKVAEVLKRAAELPPPAPLPPPPPLQPRSVVADVKYVPKLTGPVDELRALAVKDFRRLSRDPHEATLKIRDKIDLLEDQSFEVKTAGIKAWQDSETNRLYLEMLRRSLEGKPILDVIVEKEAKQEPVLSKSEFDAIMELNRKLRFG